MIPDKHPIISYTHQLRSRYGETDKMGYVYYGRYLEYFETARTEMIRNFGFSYRELEANGIMLPVIHAELTYKEPIFYDDLMDIEVRVFDRPAVRLDTYYEIWTQNRTKLHTTGRVTLVFTDLNTRKPIRCPASFIDAMINTK
jgi:acyl-CoA thioester hydrolase